MILVVKILNRKAHLIQKSTLEVFWSYVLFVNTNSCEQLRPTQKFQFMKWTEQNVAQQFNAYKLF